MSDQPTPAPPLTTLHARRAEIAIEAQNAREAAAFWAGRLAEIDAILALVSAPPAPPAPL